MTPQQFRLALLATTRRWGPFTRAETDHLYEVLQPKKQRSQDVERPYVADRIRLLQPGESLTTIKTIPMEGE